MTESKNPDNELQFEHAGLGRQLYKYCTFETAKIVLETGSLRWSRPTLFNDLFDAQFDLRTIENEEQLVPMILDRLWETATNPEEYTPGNALGILHKMGAPAFRAMGKDAYFDSIRDAILQGLERGKRHIPTFFDEVRDQVARCKILCLSEDPLSNSLWGHYADSGRGIALEFRSIPLLDSPYSVAQKVVYLDQPPLLYNEQAMIDQMAGLRSFKPDDFLPKMLFVKHRDWSWEREWRIVSGEGRFPDQNYEDIPFHQMELSAVLLGPRITLEQSDEIRGILHGKYLLCQLDRIEKGRNFRLQRVAEPER